MLSCSWRFAVQLPGVVHGDLKQVGDNRPVPLTDAYIYQLYTVQCCDQDHPGPNGFIVSGFFCIRPTFGLGNGCQGNRTAVLPTHKPIVTTGFCSRMSHEQFPTNKIRDNP